jgi:membrane-bound lytic murein transglycosylase D
MKISKSFLTFSTLLILLSSAHTYAQVPEETPEVIEESSEPKIQYPYELIVFDERDKQQYKVIIEDPVIVEQRLRTIQRQIPLVYNSNVKLWLDFFMIRRPSFTKKMLEDKDYFFPTFEKYLIQNNQPEELKYLSLLESGLNPKAISRSKAVGLWQFMSPTGKDMGLQINQYVDERMDIEKSTDAACKYLGQLYNKFGDWELALASYNTGPNRIARVMKTTGFTSYWDLHPHIHPDTRAYVPQFIALAYMMNYGNEHGIFAENKKNFIPVEKIAIRQYLDLNVFANLSNISLDELKQHNPHIKTTILPEGIDGVDISIPTDKIAYFNQYKQFILDSASRRPVYSTPVITASGENTVLANSGDGFKTLSDGTIVIGNPNASSNVSEEIEEDIVRYKSVVKQVKHVHKVKRGEFLIRIANKYDVTSAEIKRWNHLRSSKVMSGTRLVIYTNEKQRLKTTERVASKKGKKIKDVVEPEQEEQEVVVKKSKSSKKKAKQEAEEERLAAKKDKKANLENDNEKLLTHVVKKGDTLWNISQRYDGVSVDEIKKMNKISGNTVKVGQKIKIKA